MRQRRITALLLGDENQKATAQKTSFQTWAQEYAGRWFAFVDMEGQVQQVRVQGGDSGIQYRLVVQPDGRSAWSLSLILEGWADALATED